MSKASRHLALSSFARTSSRRRVERRHPRSLALKLHTHLQESHAENKSPWKLTRTRWHRPAGTVLARVQTRRRRRGRCREIGPHDPVHPVPFRRRVSGALSKRLRRALGLVPRLIISLSALPDTTRLLFVDESFSLLLLAFWPSTEGTLASQSGSGHREMLVRRVCGEGMLTAPLPTRAPPCLHQQYRSTYI